MSDLRVDYSEGLYERLDALVDMDPIKLRDLAWEMARDVETLQARIAELEAHPAMLVDPGAEARGYAKAIERLRVEAAKNATEPPGNSTLWAVYAAAADYLEATKETTG